MTVEILRAAAGTADMWLRRSALPLWLDAGWDREFGGFFDKLDQRGVPLPVDKRVRVQARQIYCYSQAGALQWDGPWRDAVERGLAFMLDAYRRPDGLFRRAVAADGAPADETADLYDQAFVILALASAYRVLDRPADLKAQAKRLLDRLTEGARHPGGGFFELGPGPASLRSNPHMHMLEALLEWVEADGDAEFAARARDITDLACRCFLDPETGAVGEYFKDDWSPASGPDGDIREPGHQFEWAYLLGEADRLIGGDHRDVSARLYAFGEKYGVNGGRVVFATDARGHPTDASSRLWAQTERLRAAITRRSAMDDDASDAHLVAAAQSFDWTWRLLDVPVPGLWRDRTTASGASIDESAPASSFYHLMTGFLPLIRTYRVSTVSARDG